MYYRKTTSIASAYTYRLRNVP